MNENSFYLRIWCLVAAVLSLLIVAANVRWHYEADRVERLAAAGVDPIAARCAIEGFSSHTDLICHGAGKQFVMNLK